MAFAVVLFKSFFEQLPHELFEAAYVDGCGYIGFFFRFTLPLSTPILATVGTFVFVQSWNNYLLPLVMLNETRTFPVTLGLTLWNSQTQRDPYFYTLVVTGSAVSVVLLVIVMVSLQRFWRANLTAGATKG